MKNNLNLLISTLTKVLCCLTVLLGLSCAVKAETFQLTSGGHSDYRIVIPSNADDLDNLAAQELADFLQQMTGVKLPVTKDNVPATAHEIVLGATNRLALNAIPAKLQPQTRDGFVLYPQNKKLFIMGKIKRGTLYGVYDFLEQELGIRFLTPDLTHVPQHKDLTVNVSSRMFDPAFEHRNLHLANAQWSVRQRLNGSDRSKSIDTHLGGTAFIRPKFVHTFGLLVPPEKYFDAHPEYYALHNGKRIPAALSGTSGQLCLSNPDVQKIIIATTREWLAKHAADQRFYDPDELMLVSISVNDNSIVCECPNCEAINGEEKSLQGTLIRMVNTVADAIENEYPNARIETLGGYGAKTGVPQKTKPHHNVLIRFATGDVDMLQPMNHANNKEASAKFAAWEKVSPVIYTWNYHTAINNHMKPYPDLTYLGDFVRYQLAHNVKGYFSESTSDRRAAFQDLRLYVLSRTLWRPELKTRELIEEYCNLSYGSAAQYILQYIDTIEEHARMQNKQLHWTDASSINGIVYDYPFLLKLNQILEAAETSAPDEKTRDRIVREHRLGLWYLIIGRGLTGEAGGSIALPIEWHFKEDPHEVGQKEKWFTEQEFNNWEKILTDRSWTVQGHDYHGTAWYSVTFNIGDDQADRIKTLQFGAVDGTHDLYLDGELVHQRHEDPAKTWNLPFVVTLENGLSVGKHTLVMRVHKASHAAGIWQPVRLLDPHAGLPNEVVVAAERFLQIAPSDPVLSQLKGWHAPQSEEITEFVKKVRWMLQQNAPSDRPQGSVMQPAAILPNTHKTHTVIDEAKATTGSAVMQTADRKWTQGQSISWNITPRIKAAHESGQLFKLRVRVRLDHKDSTGPAFRFGYAIRNENWSGHSVDEEIVAAEETSGDEWQWFTLTAPIKYVESARGMIAFVRAENNPQGVGKIYVDSFELEPLQE